MNSPSENKFKPNRKLHEGDTHIENTSLDYITTTEDKLDICAKDFVNGVTSSVYWITPLSIFITLFITILTVNFKDAFWLKANHWENIFFVATAVAAIFSIISIFKCFKYFGDSKIEKFKNDIRGN